MTHTGGVTLIIRPLSMFLFQQLGVGPQASLMDPRLLVYVLWTGICCFSLGTWSYQMLPSRLDRHQSHCQTGAQGLINIIKNNGFNWLTPHRCHTYFCMSFWYMLLLMFVHHSGTVPLTAQRKRGGSVLAVTHNSYGGFWLEHTAFRKLFLM